MPNESMNPEGAIQNGNNPVESPQGSPQHSPMGTLAHENEENRVCSDTKPQTLMSRARLRELVREVDPTLQLDDVVEDMLLQIGDDFIDTTMNITCALAKLNRKPNVELQDVQSHLEHHWNMSFPGFGNDDLHP